MNLKELCAELESAIQLSYDNGVTIEDAEKLASKFLYAQIQVSSELRNRDLDARTRKSGVKAIRAAAYFNEVEGKDKKPTEKAIESAIDQNSLVSEEQDRLDIAEVDRDELKRLYDVYGNAHIHFRTIAKGSFGN